MIVCICIGKHYIGIRNDKHGKEISIKVQKVNGSKKIFVSEAVWCCYQMYKL